MAPLEGPSSHAPQGSSISIPAPHAANAKSYKGNTRGEAAPVSAGEGLQSPDPSCFVLIPRVSNPVLWLGSSLHMSRGLSAP